MKKLRFISAQPATKYYAWQVEVMLNNFVEMGVGLNDIDIVCWKQTDEVPDEWSRLANNYAARFFFYKDTRETKHYVSSIRPNILKQHFKAHSYLTNETIFYHDSDIIFTKPIVDWITWDMVEDNNWYGSDTRWYIGHSYIKSKGDDVLNKMCQIMQLDEKLIEDNELNAIGAQYIMKGIDSAFWERVEYDSEQLFKQITDLNEEKIVEDRRTMPPNEKRNPYHPLQIWCADMWAVLWGGWRLGYKTICSPNMDFSWATSSDYDYHRMNIMHNAGVVDSTSGYFFKANWMNDYPYNINLEIKKDSASWHYYDWIKKTETKTVLL
jgi:hypothetical protein